MKIAVIGAGIIGITSAYELADAGHDVTVFEKYNAVAEGASFAPSGLIAPSLLHPMALGAHTPVQWRRFLKNAQQFSLGRGLRSADLQWLWHWSHAGQPESLATTIQSLQALYAYSMQRMRTIAAHASLEFEQSTGQLAVVRTEADEAALRPTLTLLKESGIVFKQLSREEAMKVEPALSLSTDFHAGIYFPNDEVVNCRQFAMLLKNELVQKKVNFQFNAHVAHIKTTPDLSLHVEGEAHSRSFDHIVVCSGAATHSLLQPLQSDFSQAIVCSYSLTLPLREAALAPRSAVLDTQTHITLHRLGQRIRLCGGAELGGKLLHKDNRAINKLYRMLEQFFPGAAQHTAGAQVFKSSYSIASSRLPRVGASRVPGVWINAGHGVHGWGTACGSAKLIADFIAKKTPEISTLPFQG